MTLSRLTDLHLALELSGKFPVFEPIHLFFVNLFGSIVVLWAVLRLRDPQPQYGLADAAGRFAVSA